MTTLIAVPVKDLVNAKQRLIPLLAPAERAELAQAMLEDVLHALGRACVGDVLVVTRDPAVEVLARASRRGHPRGGEQSRPHGSGGLRPARGARPRGEALRDDSRRRALHHPGRGDCSRRRSSLGPRGSLRPVAFRLRHQRRSPRASRRFAAQVRGAIVRESPRSGAGGRTSAGRPAIFPVSASTSTRRTISPCSSSAARTRAARDSCAPSAWRPGWLPIAAGPEHAATLRGHRHRGPARDSHGRRPRPPHRRGGHRPGDSPRPPETCSW